jgi:hypothetical protein
MGLSYQRSDSGCSCAQFVIIDIPIEAGYFPIQKVIAFDYEIVSNLRYKCAFCGFNYWL